jgi:hypothetical protein
MWAAPDLLSYPLALMFATYRRETIDKNDRVPIERVLRESCRRNGIAA